MENIVYTCTDITAATFKFPLTLENFLKAGKTYYFSERQHENPDSSFLINQKKNDSKYIYFNCGILSRKDINPLSRQLQVECYQ